MLPRSQPWSTSGSGDTHAGLFEDIQTRALQSVSIGQAAGKIAIGKRNNFMGVEACKEARNVNDTVAIGFQAASTASDVQFSVYIGAYAGARASGGDESVFAGYRSGEFNRDGSGLVGIGAYTFRENVAGSYSVATGYRAMERCLDGDYNAAHGAFACQDLRSARYVTSMGYMSGRAAARANSSCYFGAFAGYSNVDGQDNAFFGFRSGEQVQGGFNCAFGPGSLQFASNATSNIAIGPNALANGINATSSIVIGINAGLANSKGSQSVIIGAEAGADGQGSNTVLIGYNAGRAAVGSYSVAIGASAALAAAADFAVIIGADAGNNLRIGRGNVLIGNGANPFFETNYNGIAIGSSNTFTSDYGIAIGNEIRNQRANSILIGYDLESDANNSVVLGNNIILQSVIFFRDPLAAGFEETVLADASLKIGASNIVYPRLDTFARAGVATSNITDPNIGGPITPTTGYDLRFAVPSYSIAHGAFYAIESSANLGESIQVEDITPESSLALSNTSSPSLAYGLNSYSLKHTSTAYFMPVAIPGSSSTFTLNVLGFGCNVASVPIAVAKRIRRSLYPDTSKSLTLASSPFAIPLADTAFSSTTWQPIAYLPDDGLPPQNLPIGSCQQEYFVIDAPHFGKLASTKVLHLSNLAYTRLPESAFATTDQLSICPALRITDDINVSHRVTGARNLSLELSFAPTQSPRLFANNEIVLTGTATMPIQFVSIPVFPQNSIITITSLDENLILIVNGEEFNGINGGLPDLPSLFYSNSLGIKAGILITSTFAPIAGTITYNGTDYAWSVNVSLAQESLLPFDALPEDIDLIDPSNVFVVKEPLYGKLLGTLYTRTNPFAITPDSAKVVIVDEITNTSRDLTLTFPQPPNIFTSDFTTALNSYIQVTEAPVFTYSLESIDYINKFVSNVVISNTNTYDIDGSLFSSTSTSTSNVILNYNPSEYYHTRTSNLFISSNLEIASTESGGALDGLFYTYVFNTITSNIGPDASSNIIISPQIISTSDVVPQQEYLGLSSNISIAYDLDIVQINMQAVRIITNRVVSELKTYNYVSSMDSDPMYTSNVPKTNVATPETISISSPTVTTTGPLFDVSSNMLRSYTYTVKEPVVPLNHNYFSFAAPGILTTNKIGGFIERNIGPVSSVTQNAINSRSAWIRVDNEFSNASFNGTSINVTRSTILTTSDTIAINMNLYEPYTDRIPLSSIFTEANISVPELATRIQVIDVLNGAMVTTNELTNAVAMTRTSIIDGVYQVTGKYPSDTLRFFFIDEETNAISTIYAIRMSLLRRANPSIGQDLNIGLSSNYDPSLLSAFYASQPGLNNSELKVITSGGTTNPATFTMEHLLAGDVSIIGAPTSIPYQLRNNSTNSILVSGLSYPLRIYNHASWPDPTDTLTEIRIQAIGSNFSPKVTKHGAFWSEFQTRSILGAAPNALNVIIKDIPQEIGFLWSSNTSNDLASKVSYTSLDVNARSLVFIPRAPGPSGLSNVTANMQFELSGRVSPTYPIVIKNYISRFPYTSIQSEPADIPRSIGLVNDGWTWTKPTSSTWRLARGGNEELFNGIWSIADPFEPILRNSINSNYQFTIDQADRFSIALPTTASSTTYYVSQPPTHGIIAKSMAPGVPIVSFASDDQVFYQHLGASSPTTDTFELRSAQNPYELGVGRTTYDVTILPLPIVTRNNIDNVYYTSSAIALATQQSLFSNMTVNGTDSESALIVTSSQGLSFVQETNRVLIAGNDALYSVHQTNLADYFFNLAPVAQATQVNALSAYDAYNQLFIYKYSVLLNQFYSSNIITLPQQPIMQNISYNMNSNLVGYENIQDKIVKIEFQVQPTQPFAASVDATAFLRTYAFTFILKNLDGSALFTKEFTKDDGLLFDAWNTITFLNIDAAADNVATLSINGIRAMGPVEPISFASLGEITIEMNTRSLPNFIESGLFTQEFGGLGGLNGTFNLTNYRTEILYRNFEVTATTYTANEVQTDIHNIIIGKDIIVRGFDNICMGNRFRTSGRNSIIFGNDIGESKNSIGGEINDVYESIIIGTQSFQNSIVRDVIAMGRNILNDLSQAPLTRVSDFLSKRPVLIGNDISADSIDFHVNIDNTFLKTNVGGQQIYLGIKGEAVAVGYETNAQLPVGGIYTRHHIATPRVVIECTGTGVQHGDVVTVIGMNPSMQSMGGMDEPIPIVESITSANGSLASVFVLGMAHIVNGSTVFVTINGLQTLEMDALPTGLIPGQMIYVNTSGGLDATGGGVGSLGRFLHGTTIFVNPTS